MPLFRYVFSLESVSPRKNLAPLLSSSPIWSVFTVTLKPQLLSLTLFVDGALAQKKPETPVEQPSIPID